MRQFTDGPRVRSPACPTASNRRRSAVRLADRTTRAEGVVGRPRRELGPALGPQLVERVDRMLDVEPAEAGEAGRLGHRVGPATRAGRGCRGRRHRAPTAPTTGRTAPTRRTSARPCGFLATFSAKESRALMSTSSHTPSSCERGADRLHHLLRVGHVVDAVEGRHEVDRAVRGQRLVRGRRGSGRWSGRARARRRSARSSARREMS